MTEQLGLAEARTRSGRKSRRNLGITEDDLLRSVRKIAGYTGYLVYHTRWSKGSEPGFPDVVLASATRKRLIFAELKTETGKPTAAQQLWLDTLTATGNEAYLWRPADLTDDTILTTLTSRRIPEDNHERHSV
jgi:VRR-NUC domain